MKNRTHERLVFATKAVLSTLAAGALFIAGLAVIQALVEDPYNLAAVGIVWLSACLAFLAVLVDRARAFRPARTTRTHRRNR